MPETLNISQQDIDDIVNEMAEAKTLADDGQVEEAIKRRDHAAEAAARLGDPLGPIPEQ